MSITYKLLLACPLMLLALSAPYTGTWLYEEVLYKTEPYEWCAAVFAYMVGCLQMIAGTFGTAGVFIEL